MNKLKIISLIQICAFTVFLGRAYQLYFFGGPFRALLWDESLLSPIVEGIFNITWYDYATSPKVNQWIDSFTKISSLIFLVAGVFCLFWNKIKYQKLKSPIVTLAMLLFLFIGVCMVKDRNYDLLQLFELSIQFVAPILLLLNHKIDLVNNKKVIIGIKIAIACTFTAHGLFAMGLIYLPGHFVDMTIKLLSVNEAQASIILYIAGVLDIVTSILIFIPKLSKYALLYMIFWGFTTAFARLVAGFSQDFISMSLHNSTYLVVYRLSHGLVPLIVLLMDKKNEKEIVK